MSKFKTMADRLAEHTDTSDRDGCWLWGGRLDRDGYGRLRRDTLAHRAVFEELVGPIPEGHELDHLCRNRACVNPTHLEPVTRTENNRRRDAAGNPRLGRTHCRRGHEYTPENTYVAKHGSRSYRSCRACQRAAAAARYLAKKVAA